VLWIRICIKLKGRIWIKAILWIRIRIQIKVISWIWIRIHINLQMTSQNVLNMTIFEHFFKDWDLYMEARIRIRLQIKMPMVRINIKVMRIRKTAGEFAKSLLIRK
jgi:hypothetical protein